MAWWRILVDYFTPDSLRGDWEGMRRLRLMLGLSLIGLILGGMYGVFYGMIGHHWGMMVIVVCILLQLCVPFLIRTTGQVRLGGHLSLVVWGIGFTLLAALEGGIHGFGVVWLACGGPLLALLILDRLEALFWCAFCFLSTLVFCVLELAGIPLPLKYPEDWHPQVLSASIMGLIVFLSLLGILFEHARKEAVMSMQGALNDLSEANERTHRSERFVQRIADTTPGLIYMFDLQERTIVYANERLIQLLGFSPANDLGIKVRSLSQTAGMPDFDRILEGARQRLWDVKDGAFIATEYTFKHSGVESCWECRDTVFSRTPAGEPLCVLGLAVNNTEQKRTERARLAAEGANRAKDQFLAVLSHELRTPLTPVLATATELEEQADLSPEVRMDMSMVRRNVELEARLIDDLLDVTRISSGKLVLHLGTVDAHSCLQSVLEICRAAIEAKGLQVAIVLEAVQHHVTADPVRLRQVFWNLLSNSIKFTPAQGRISVSTSNIGDKLRVQVTDTGVGIEPDVLPRIFNAFEQGEQTPTRRFGGLGLGLSIAKTVVDMHHGQITASSGGKNQGVTFTVELSTVAAGLAQPVTSLTSRPRNGKLPRILLVEDDRDTLQVLFKLLQRHGYEVSPADSVQKGLELSAQGSFDILVSDLGLLDGSGLDLMRKIKALYGMPGIALSGFGTDDDLRRSRAAGFDQHIIKPVNFNVLRTAIQQITGK